MDMDILREVERGMCVHTCTYGATTAAQRTRSLAASTMSVCPQALFKRQRAFERRRVIWHNDLTPSCIRMREVSRSSWMDILYCVYNMQARQMPASCSVCVVHKWMGVSSRAHFSALARLAYTCAGTRGLTVGTYALVVVWCERKGRGIF